MATKREQLELFPLPPRQNVTRPPLKSHAQAIARRFGLWTGVKLEVFRLYNIMYGRVTGNGNYIDAFAGSGRAIIGGIEQDGSALIALRRGSYKRRFYFELDPETRAHLQYNLSYHSTLKKRNRTWLAEGQDADSNIGIPKLLASGRIPVDEPCFAFLDPDSTQLAWGTLEALASFKALNLIAGEERYKVELWVLVNTGQALQRMWRRRTKATDMPIGLGALDRMFGGRDAWLPLWKEGASLEALRAHYEHQMRTALGYRFVDSVAIREKINGPISYYMIHASDHPAAPKFMKWAENEQLPDRLLGGEAIPKLPDF